LPDLEHEIAAARACSLCAHTLPLGPRPLLKNVQLTLAVGSDAIAHLLGKSSMTDMMRDFRAYLPGVIPLPPPSWRTQSWETRNLWFGAEVLPTLRMRVAELLQL